ncbi:MAG: tetratricopeptide repeat protein [Deltaproteobacteria bacterium]|nr:tetratricopeptide repeat protein [Deltaproteobacteria bacterium]
MNTERDLSFEDLFPLDKDAGPVRFRPEHARAMVENAIDTWQRQQPIVSRFRRHKLLLLAATVFAVASTAAGLFYASTGENRAASPKNAASPSTASARYPGKSSDSAPSSLLGTTDSPATARTSEDWLDKAGAKASKKPAEDLLQIANKQRQQGKWREAEQTYRRVCTIYPNSASAYVALIAAASIRLEKLNNPTGALALYNQAIASNPDGALDIEARMGVARSWQRLGNESREIESLRTLLRKYASGPIAQQAKRRLEVVAGGD